MLSRDKAADGAAARAEQRADDHHDHGHYEEVGEQQTADSMARVPGAHSVRPRQPRQMTGRRIHQKQKPPSMMDRPRKIASSYHCMGQ